MEPQPVQNVTARFLVGGQHFAINASLLEYGPPSRLTHMYAGVEDKQGTIAVDRPPELFSAILAFYQTRDLHIPIISCPNAFLKEMEYWDIGLEHVSDCCLTRYGNNRFIYVQMSTCIEHSMYTVWSV